MKILVLFGILSFGITCFSQEEVQEYSSENSIQFLVFPGLIYNSVALGIGIKKQKIEHTLELYSQYIPIGAERFVVGTYYNQNYYLKNDRTFIPLWTGINRVNVDNNYEDGGPYFDKMNIMIGSGIGTNLTKKKSHKFRVELGVGAAVHLENRNSYDNESSFPFKLAISKFTLSENYPIIPSFRLKIRYIIPFKQKTYHNRAS